MQGRAPDFRLYHSNALDVLAGLMAAELRTRVPGQPLLQPDVVLIPQAAMRRWLQATLAQAHGVAANLEFLTPGEFVQRALDANVPGKGQDLDAAALHWRIHAALGDPSLMRLPAMRPLRDYLDAGAVDPLRAWSLAGELAQAFEKYKAWRRDWLLGWEAGQDPREPQALLWRHVAAGSAHRARRIHEYLEGFAGADAPLPAGLPKRLFAFAILNVSPDVLRVIATQSRGGTLHLYVPSPTRDYWGDLQRRRARVGDVGADASDAENPLLRAWGAAGRDFMAVLGGYEVVHPDTEIRADADPGDGGGALHGSLLRRLQSDLFNRRPAPEVDADEKRAGGLPPAADSTAYTDAHQALSPSTRSGADTRTRLPALRRDDPSLQVHACHTRLRELQVLHDQLRALFEDPRFDPPLQPREVAVLAPDIDPYIPYLDAVFGGRGRGDAGFNQAIPYAVADASPLAGEPLAEVFLRLLGLPVARFGLEETLDLLASPPLADAAGLDAAAFARLHAWLHAAGARWGIDAAHRARLDAPQDDAYTWAFALDRLLLGHATGSDAPVEGSDGQLVAPLPELEGSALDALDTLVRLLRVLARHARLLDETLPPDAWRERLLGLLDALLPRPPSTPAAQRALDRLRGLIDTFAADARRAGVDTPIAADVVRAHFAAALGAADTRAPLLTGGISIGRMVPMRLLPFRVICLLGMDDGAFPRRDPAGGLDRLAAELGSERRRIGDRSTRDDDRFLFLQLFAAAQDVFYVSYQGADPRDGSAREPSVLVADLLQAVDAQHVPDADAGKALVVHHPLQPFAAAAFGAGDEPRRFSYRQQWWPAASQPLQRRVPLAPWFGDDALPEVDQADVDGGDGRLALEDLSRFLRAPADVFLRQRLGLRLSEVESVEGDVEPLLAPGRGYARQLLQRAVFDAHLRGEDDATAHALLRARGMLPSGALGRRTLQQVRGQVEAYAQAFGGWRAGAVPAAPRVEADIDGTTLHGRIADVYPQGLVRMRFDPPAGASAIRNGLDWLLASAAGQGLPLVEFHDGGDAGVGPHVREPLDAGQARDVLRHLLALRSKGLRRPLPFGPYSGWELFSAGGDLRKGLDAAAKRWHGSGRSWGEGNGEALRLALRGRDPFAHEPTQLEFVDLAMTIYGAVVHGQLYTGTDAQALHAIAESLDLEDAE